MLFTVNVRTLTVSVLVVCFLIISGVWNVPENVATANDYNPCCGLPCRRRGICIPLSNDEYECDCPRGHYGKVCEKSTWFVWLKERLIAGHERKQKLASSGKLIWGIINNIPFLHETALRNLLASGTDLRGPGSEMWRYSHDYSLLGVHYNRSTLTRALPPVPWECPTPLGVKGPQTLPEIDEVFDLLFDRKEFKPCPFNSNIMFLTFTQFLFYQLFRTDPLAENEKMNDFLGFGPDREASGRDFRSFKHGKLKTRIINGEEYPPYLDDVPEVSAYYAESECNKNTFPKWAMGHKMLNITPFMFAMATIWLREHNRVCDVILREHPDWKDERIYRTARWIVLGELLTITAGEYFQHLTQYRIKLGYKPDLFDSGGASSTDRIQYEFGMTLQWHPMMPDVISLQGKSYNLTDLTFGSNRVVFEHGLDGILDFMSRTPAGEITYRNCGKTFKKMMKRLIEEGRKTRLHSLNDYRRSHDLQPHKSFLDLVGDKEMAQVLQGLYGDINAVEFIVGAFIEKHKGSVVPQTMMSLTVPVVLKGILNNPIGSSVLWCPSTFGGKFGFDIVQKCTLKKLFCQNLKGNCKNNVWVSFKTPPQVKTWKKKICTGLS